MTDTPEPSHRLPGPADDCPYCGKGRSEYLTQKSRDVVHMGQVVYECGRVSYSAADTLDCLRHQLFLAGLEIARLEAALNAAKEKD